MALLSKPGELEYFQACVTHILIARDGLDRFQFYFIKLVWVIPFQYLWEVIYFMRKVDHSNSF